MDKQTDNCVVYHEDTDSFSVFYSGSEMNITSFLKAEGFRDADILHEDWLERWEKIYSLDEGWRKSLRENGYCTIGFVGFPCHVIPQDRLSAAQRFFIKRTFND